MNPKPHVCHLLHGLALGGVERCALRLALGTRPNFKASFCCLDSEGVLAEDARKEGFAVTALGRSPGVDWSCVRRLRTWLQEAEVDLIHAHTWSPFFYAASARWPKGRIPILYTEHARPHPDRRRLRRVIFNRLMLQPSDQVTAVSSWAAKQVARNEGIPTRRIRVISNGVEENEDSGLGNQREDLGLEKGRPLLLQVGRLDPLKDVATSLRVMKRLQGDVQAILVLIGEGPDRGRLETMAQSLHLEDSVMFMGARRDVAAWMSAADVLLHTSLSEALPLVLLEAMEAGLPVVAADVGGVRELVMDGRTGLLAGVGDDLQLTNHILRLLRDPRLAESMGRTGRERVRRHFREDTMVQNYEQSYWSILRGSMGRNARGEQKANGSPSARL